MTLKPLDSCKPLLRERNLLVKPEKFDIAYHQNQHQVYRMRHSRTLIHTKNGIGMGPKDGDFVKK